MNCNGDQFQLHSVMLIYNLRCMSLGIYGSWATCLNVSEMKYCVWETVLSNKLYLIHEVYFYLHQVTKWCVSVCVCVCLCVRSGPVNQTSLKRLKLRTSNLTCMFPDTVRTWPFKNFSKGSVARVKGKLCSKFGKDLSKIVFTVLSTQMDRLWTHGRRWCYVLSSAMYFHVRYSAVFIMLVYTHHCNGYFRVNLISQLCPLFSFCVLILIEIQ